MDQKIVRVLDAEELAETPEAISKQVTFNVIVHVTGTWPAV